MPTLYRYYDEYGRLLYVGQTGKGRSRGSSHASSARWWHLVHFAEFHEVSTASIDQAERFAIWVEQPLFNIVGRVTTAQRQAMRARLDQNTYEDSLIHRDIACEILGLSFAAVKTAVFMGFLETDYPRALWVSPAQLRAFIGDSDDGPLEYDPRRWVRMSVSNLKPRFRGRILRDLAE